MKCIQIGKDIHISIIIFLVEMKYFGLLVFFKLLI